MAEETVGHLAESIGTPSDRLLLQIEEAGLSQRSVDDVIDEDDKVVLLAFLKKSHGEDDGAPRKITLKRRTLSTLKTGGSAGRGRTVNVEVRKKKTYVRREAVESEAEVELPSADPVITEVPVVAQPNADADSERKRQEAVEQKIEEEKAKVAKANEAKAAVEALPVEAPVLTQEEVEAAAEEARISSRKDKRDRHDLDEEEEKKKKKASKSGGRKRRVEELLDDDLLNVAVDEELIIEPEAELKEDEAVTLGLSSPRSRRSAKPAKRHKFNAPTEDVKREVELAETITIQQLSQKMSIKAKDVLRTLFNLGVVKTVNESIDQDTATLIVEEYGHTVKLIELDAVERSLESGLVYVNDAQARAPVVTVMGHVDHGKTSLLDYIRSAKVASGEAGGITQHIGAYRVATEHGEICFIDTPGHAAFTAMRKRGANATDIVILVVAADDGVMPQTEEAIKHAKAAGVPIVVAVNKMDKEGADPDRVKSELAARDVIPDDWGGDTQYVQVSALTGDGIDNLLEAVLLQAELLELTAVQVGPATGVVIESALDKGRGPIVTLLVQNGTLNQGDIIVAGQYFGRARALIDDNGTNVKVAGPATPVAVLGFNGTPDAGDTFVVTKDEKQAREVARIRAYKANEQRLSTGTSLETMLENFGAPGTETLKIVVKADVRGSLEAIVTALNALGNDEVKVQVITSGVGGITESEASYAATSGAVIFGFNVRADNAAKRIIENEGLDLRYYKVIYDLVDDVRAALSGMLSPEIREDIVGIAEVRDVFVSKKLGQIAGCMVIEGTVSRRKNIRVLRDNVVIYEGELESLRHFKEEVQNVSSGTECGIGVKNYNDVRVKDKIEVFDTREVARHL